MSVGGIFDVLDYGAKRDGVINDAPSIQAALNAAEPAGGVVWLTPGPKAYRCDGPLTIPPNVTLKGGYGGMRRGLREPAKSPRGSLLHVYTTADFISLSSNSILDGVEIYYPNQKTSGTPDPYGWTIKMPQGQNGGTIRDVCSPNPYQFIYAANADGFLIEGVQGYPLALGIQLDRVADVPRLNNIHFQPNCWSDAGPTLHAWVQTNGIGMRILGVEEFMINNFFVYGYLRGLWFDTYHDPGFPGNYGSLNVFGFDSVQEGILIGTRGISHRQGFSISNGRIIPLAGQFGARAGIKFSDTDPGQGPGVSVSNVGFFGFHQRSIWIEPKSGAKISIHGGQSTEYTNEMVLCQSSQASVRLVAVRSFNGNGPRVGNPGGGNICDLSSIED